MGSVANCFDNALAESVFATLECELFDRQPGGRFATRREAKLAVFDYLETFYNPRRRHSALGQLAPATFEARHTLTTAACASDRSNEVSTQAGQLYTPRGRGDRPSPSCRDGRPASR